MILTNLMPNEHTRLRSGDEYQFSNKFSDGSRSEAEETADSCRRNFINELLFWAHLGLLMFAVGSGFFLSLPVIVLLIILHRIHVWLFGGCLFSRFQEILGGIPKNISFIQLVARRLFGLELTQAQSHRFDYLLVTITFMTAIVQTLA